MIHSFVIGSATQLDWLRIHLERWMDSQSAMPGTEWIGGAGGAGLLGFPQTEIGSQTAQGGESGES